MSCEWHTAASPYRQKMCSLIPGQRYFLKSWERFVNPSHGIIPLERHPPGPANSKTMQNAKNVVGYIYFLSFFAPSPKSVLGIEFSVIRSGQKFEKVENEENLYFVFKI